VKAHETLDLVGRAFAMHFEQRVMLMLLESGECDEDALLDHYNKMVEIYEKKKESLCEIKQVKG